MEVEPLEAGIDVSRLVNVQHLESLNDVVSGVTGIQVRETVPDPSIRPEVVLVDLPPTICVSACMKQVYIAGQAERAIGFFRKGNLDFPCANWLCAGRRSR